MHCVPGGFSFTAGAKIRSLTLALYDLKGVQMFGASVKGGDKLFIPQKESAFGPGPYVAKVTARYSNNPAPEILTEKIFWR